MAVIKPVEDMGPPPDLGPLNGPPCDPRLNARVRVTGFFCVQIPGQRPNVGACQRGDRCEPGVEGTCPPERPYCHLKGGATVCSEYGDLEEGQDCVDENQIPQPHYVGSFAVATHRRSHVFRVPKMSVQMRAVVRTF